VAAVVVVATWVAATAQMQQPLPDVSRRQRQLLLVVTQQLQVLATLWPSC
jgi:hypothetical protein